MKMTKTETQTIATTMKTCGIAARVRKIAKAAKKAR